jgi:hypothetical protein
MANANGERLFFSFFELSLPFAAFRPRYNTTATRYTVAALPTALFSLVWVVGPLALPCYKGGVGSRRSAPHFFARLLKIGGASLFVPSMVMRVYFRRREPTVTPGHSSGLR